MSLLLVLHHTKNRIFGADCYLFISYWSSWQDSTNCAANILVIPIIPAFRSFQLPGRSISASRSSFPVVLAFQFS
jgi:hypothetical protein